MSESESTANKDSSVTDITEILDRFKSKRSKKTGHKDNLKQQREKPKTSSRKRKFYNEEDDKLWVKYFHGEEPQKKDSIKTKQADNQTDTQTGTASDTAKGVQFGRTPKRKTKTQKKYKREKSSKTLPTLDSTHTSSEAKVYSIMYRETITKGVSEGYFSVRGLMSDTGLGSPNTVRSALKGLRAKKSIELIGELNNSPLGTRYRVYHPKEIFKTRNREEVIIDTHTKKVISVRGKFVEDISSPSVSHTDSDTVSQGVSRIDTATVSRNDTVNQDIPYIYNNINNDSKESSSNNKKNNDVDKGFDHKNYIIALYEKYTGNNWKKETDNDSYELVKEKTPGVIEAGIISSVLRAQEDITSFSSCEGCINEFTQNFPPGYLGYLREKWKEVKETEGKLVYLVVPENSYFREEWLKNYLSNFSGEERKRIKRLAEQFDHFMLTSGAGKEWIKNPTGAFVGLVRGEVNITLSRDAPTFEERVGGAKNEN